ncbi:MAG: carbohydrate ABC transporter permease [Acidimicrobiales bacterium]
MPLRRTTGRSTRLIRAVLTAALAAVFLLPLVLMVTGSLEAPGTPPSRAGRLVPESPSVQGYREAFELVDLGRYLGNSLLVVAVAVPLSVLCASWAGFVIASARRRARIALVALAAVAFAVPSTALVVGRFTLFKGLGLLDTYAPLVAPALLGTSSLYVLLYAWSFHRLAPEHVELARLEGLGPLQLWRHVAMPLVRPVTVAVAVLSFSLTWGNFLDPLVYLSDERLFTVPLGLRSLSLVGHQDVPVFLAGAVVATAPVLVAFVCIQRHFFETAAANGSRR